MHLIDANEVDQQIRTHYMLWAVRNVEEMHPTIDSELIWNKKGFIIYIYIERERDTKVVDWCYMCKCNSETVDNLFLHCLVAMNLWAMSLGLFGVCWVMPKSVVDLLASWQGQFGRRHNKYVWIVVPHCLVWCIWKERNNSFFEDSEHSLPNLKLFFFRTLMDWLSVWRNQSFSSILDLLDLCKFCI